LIKRFVTLLLITGFCAATSAEGRDTRTERVRFKGGQTSTSITGKIIGYESVTYLIGAEAGQTMTITLRPSNSATYFNVQRP
jgi:hypothetical protein